MKAQLEVILLGVRIEKKLKFKSHIEELCRNAAYKLHALRRIRKFLIFEKTKLLANGFINSQFYYESGCLLVNHQFLKLVKYTFKRFKLLVIIMKNLIMAY